MPEISLSILDIVQNSIRADANFIRIKVEINRNINSLIIEIEDNGVGMTKEEVEKVVDPFYTTRTTRAIGLGIPFFKQAVECTGGQFQINSTPCIGTIITANFTLSHIDRMPLGNMTETMHLLITTYSNINFCYSYMVNNYGFTLDTREFHNILGDIPFHLPEVSTYIKEYLKENHDEVNQGNTTL